MKINDFKRIEKESGTKFNSNFGDLENMIAPLKHGESRTYFINENSYFDLQNKPGIYKYTVIK